MEFWEEESNESFAAVAKLRPPKCEENASTLCSSPSQVQLAVLHIGLALSCIGMAGSRFTLGPLGAYQFDKPKHQTTFFNWYIFTVYISNAISSTAIVYVQDNVVLGIVEAKRLKLVQQGNSVAAMSVFWLVPSLALAGFGEAFHFIGHVEFYYQEFPESLKSTSTAVVAVSIGIAFYLGNALIDIIRKTTGWLPDDINRGRLNNVYWRLVSVLGGINFCYYLLCASMYKYKNAEKRANESNNKD